MDWTLPVERGVAPGNGTLVSAVHAAVGRMPIVAGKPETPLFDVAVERFAATHPFFVGDRLDTDIAGANAADMPSALVLTGIDGPREVLAAPERARPPFLLADLRGLFEPYPDVRPSSGGYRSKDAVVRIDGRRIEVVRPGEPVDVLRAAAHAVWSSGVSAWSLEVPDAVLAAR
ncbi:MAG TPA: HAD hydrolase-like protein, partial [Amnibacterium sp.]|nr:HAD hydrolase-like protein [Amnibacterium sp.]